MTSDRTEHQSTEELRQARELSLEPARPPATIPGYKLQQFIGSGAYGEVWSGTDLKTGRRVAVKFYTRRNRSDVELLAREVEKLVVLSADRYVVQLLDVGWDADPPYYVMEYIEHGSLEDRLKSGDPLPVPEAVALFHEIATGMMNLHGKGILHCDLKPGNVLIDQDGRPRVADFGQSRLSTDETPALGTLFYMAPEQADVAAMPDTSWDVYGLGALLFSMLTGRPPYYSPEFAKEIETTQKIGDRLSKYRETLLQASLPTEHRNLPGVDRALADIIDRCIATDPKRRFNSVQSVLLALQQREHNRTRRPLMLLGIIAPMLLMAIVTTFGWFAFNQAVSQAGNAVSERAQDSNFFAAQLAARSAAEQIDEYFRVVSQLARDPDFVDSFRQVVDDDDLKPIRLRLADPTQNIDTETGVDPLATLRAQFVKHPVRERLQPELERRLFDPNQEFPPAASWFVCDRAGTQIASVFPKENQTLGSNFSFRTYFTGEDRDIDLDQIQQLGHLDESSQRHVIEEPHLSAIFRSQQTRKWKVAFSAPIMIDNRIAGIVAVTVDLGALVEFAGRSEQYAILVDGRTGENTGTVLEHPIFEEYQRLNDTDVLPNDLATMKVDLDKAAIPDELFIDPVGKTSFGKKSSYGKESFVSIVNVTRADRSPRRSMVQDSNGKPLAVREPTNLFVMAVQNRESVMNDVRDLGAQLQWLAIKAGLALLLAAASIAFFVSRMLRDSRDRLSRVYSPTRDTSPINEMETIPDVRNQVRID